MLDSYFKINYTTAVLATLQLLAPALTCVAVLYASTQALGIPFDESYITLASMAAGLCALFVRPMLSQQQTALSSGVTVAWDVGVSWFFVVVILLLLGYATKVSAVYSRRALFAWFVLTPPLLVVVMLLLRLVAGRLLMAAGQTRSAVVVGANEVGLRLIQRIRKSPGLGLDCKGIFDDRSAARLGDAAAGEILGRFADIADYVRSHKIDMIFIATPFRHLERTEKLLVALQDTTASIYFVPDVFVFELIQARTTDIGGIPIVAIRETPFVGWQGLTKRASDIILTSFLIVILLPVFVLIAIAIKWTGQGSVFFKQRRYGLDGQEIVVYKFRTMTVSEDGSHIEQVKKNDPRLTRIGSFLRKYSLDELPQLFNVLQGRMSLVGPRPHAVAHNEMYRQLITGYMVRHKMLPGITGLAQVNGCRGETATVEDMKRRVDYDLQYLQQWSLALDLRILARTLAVWFRDGKAW